MNDISLIAGADSPFEPWVRDAVRELRNEVEVARIAAARERSLRETSETAVREAQREAWRRGFDQGWYKAMLNEPASTAENPY